MGIEWKDLNKALSAYVENIQAELVERWNNVEVSSENRELTEVIFGLLSRQLSITVYFLSSPYLT